MYKVLHKWFTAMRSEENHVNGPATEKAKYFYNENNQQVHIL
jgi:hypothetical protein